MTTDRDNGQRDETLARKPTPGEAGGRREGSTPQVLILDHDPDVLRLCGRILGNSYNVYSTRSRQQALQIASQTPIDVVILEHRPPELDGISSFEAIRAFQHDVIGIATTSYPSLEAVVEATRRGMSDFVLKPFTPSELRAAVARSLEHQRLQSENARLKALIPLYEVSRTLMSTTDLDTLFDQVIDVAVEETGADRVSLMLEERGTLTIAAAHGLPEEIVQDTCTPVGEGIAGWVAKYGEPLLLNDDTRMPPELEDALRGGKLASAVCAPLTVKDQTIGVLNLAKWEGTEQPFTPSDRDLIALLAGQVAVAIENARLFQHQRILTEQIAQLNATLHALQHTSSAATSTLSVQRILQAVLDGCTAVMRDAIVALGLLDLQRSSIEVHLGRGNPELRDITRLTLSEENVATASTRAGMKAVLTERLSQVVQSYSEVSNLSIIRLKMRGQMLGAIAVGSDRDLTEADVASLRPFADQAAVAVANARLSTALQRAQIDWTPNQEVTSVIETEKSPQALRASP